MNNNKKNILEPLAFIFLTIMGKMGRLDRLKERTM